MIAGSRVVARERIAFAVMTWLLPNIDYTGDIPQLILLALVAGVVNGLIKPIVRLLSLPVRVATLGLFSLVINAGMLLLVAWISGKLDIPFSISDEDADSVRRRIEANGSPPGPTSASNRVRSWVASSMSVARSPGMLMARSAT